LVALLPTLYYFFVILLLKKKLKILIHARCTLVPQVSLRVTTAVQYSVDTDKVDQFFFKVIHAENVPKDI
jgi:hypothetical protein